MKSYTPVWAMHIYARRCLEDYPWLPEGSNKWARYERDPSDANARLIYNSPRLGGV